MSSNLPVSLQGGSNTNSMVIINNFIRALPTILTVALIIVCIILVYQLLNSTLGKMLQKYLGSAAALVGTITSKINSCVNEWYCLLLAGVGGFVVLVMFSPIGKSVGEYYAERLKLNDAKKSKNIKPDSEADILESAERLTNAKMREDGGGVKKELSEQLKQASEKLSQTSAENDPNNPTDEQIDDMNNSVNDIDRTAHEIVYGE